MPIMIFFHNFALICLGSFNRFSYAMNNPLCYVDENGESLLGIICAIVGA